MPLQDCFDKLAEWAGYSTQITRDIDPSAIAFKEVSDPERLCPTPLVSVLVRTYNAEKTIGRAIESIVTQQTDFPFELVIADDASTDGTVAVCREWLTKHPDKIRILCAKKNGGVSYNAVLTHSQARGEWVAECDPDDYWLETCKLQRQMDLIRKHNAVLCVTEYLVRDVRDNRLYMFPLPKTEVVPPRELARAYFQLGSLLYSKAAYEQMVREIPLDFQSDVRKANCLARYGKVVCLHDVASVWVVGGGTYSSRAETTKSLIVMSPTWHSSVMGPGLPEKCKASSCLRPCTVPYIPKPASPRRNGEKSAPSSYRPSGTSSGVSSPACAHSPSRLKSVPARAGCATRTERFPQS